MRHQSNLLASAIPCRGLSGAEDVLPVARSALYGRVGCAGDTPRAVRLGRGVATAGAPPRPTRVATSGLHNPAPSYHQRERDNFGRETKRDNANDPTVPRGP